jgi:hypothetical protein
MGQDAVKLSPAERAALREVARCGGNASWYQVARAVIPPEFPDEDTHSVRLLQRLAALGHIVPTAMTSQMQRYTITSRGQAALDRP